MATKVYLSGDVIVVDQTGQPILNIPQRRARFTMIGNRPVDPYTTVSFVSVEFFDILTEVKKLHSYTTPEIIALPIIAGSADYLKWIETETG